MQLSTREGSILKMILDGDGFVTMNTIAQRLSLSKRTILRELDKLHELLGEQSALLETKAGYGVRFRGDEEQRKTFRELVGLSRQNPSGLSPTERVNHLLTQLLTEQEPIKIFTFTQELDVTEATIGSDLNRCEVWLSENHIELVRKPGVGIYIEADEWRRRQALVALFYQNTDENPREYDMPPISGLYDREKLSRIRTLVDSAPDVREIFLSDRSYTAIVVHLYFILQRVEADCSIAVDDLAKMVEEDEEATRLAARLLTMVQREFHVDIPPGELGYLATILQSAQGLKQFDDRYREQQARRIADKLMRITENKTGLIIGNNNAFYDALLRHLIPTISRLNMHMEIRNPMLDDIKKHYGELYELAKLGVSAIEEELGVGVPESEIGYIAIHLGVALEDRRMHLQRRYKAIICCPSGIISAKLLSLRVEREFSDIAIVDVISTMSLDYDDLRRQGAELIISTVPIRDCPLPCAVVSPFLLDEEKENVRQLLICCKHAPRQAASTAEHIDIASSLEGSKRFIDSILDLLNNFFYMEGKRLSLSAELVELVAETVGRSDLQQAAIARSLFAREQYGSTLTPDGRCMLLHCRTPGVSQPYLGIIRLDGRVTLESGQQPLVALIMLAPQDCTRQAMDVLSAVGSSTVEYPWMVDALCTGGRDECYSAIEQVLADCYENSPNHRNTQ